MFVDMHHMHYRCKFLFCFDAGFGHNANVATQDNVMNDKHNVNIQSPRSNTVT